MTVNVGVLRVAEGDENSFSTNPFFLFPMVSLLRSGVVNLLSHFLSDCLCPTSSSFTVDMLCVSVYLLVVFVY